MKTIDTVHGAIMLDDNDFYAIALLGFRVYAKKQTEDYCRAMVRTSSYKGESFSIILSRFLLGVTRPEVVVDHADRNPLNNQRSNLRLCTQFENSKNARKKKGCSSQYKGVYRLESRKKWGAVLYHLGGQRNLGYFETEIEAAQAYNKKALEVFGEFAFQNEIIPALSVNGDDHQGVVQ
jgi:hypothetical protein